MVIKIGVIIEYNLMHHGLIQFMVRQKQFSRERMSYDTLSVPDNRRNPRASQGIRNCEAS